jgi:hypothetical protein
MDICKESIAGPELGRAKAEISARIEAIKKEADTKCWSGQKK